MIFDALYDSSKRGELLLIDGGFCHWHLRRDGQLTIREIISTKKGSGSKMLEILKETPGAISLFAKCPIQLESNLWYKKMGFVYEGIEITKNNNQLNLWRYKINE